MSTPGSIASLVAFECLLVLVAAAGNGAQGDEGQDQPIAFGAILIVILGAGSTVGSFVAVLVYAATLHRKRQRR